MLIQLKEKKTVVNPKERNTLSRRWSRKSSPSPLRPNRISLLLRTARYLAEIESLSSPLIYASLAGEARGSIDPVAAEPSRRKRVTPPLVRKIAETASALVRRLAVSS